MRTFKDKLFGFSLTGSTYVKEIDATLFDFTHDKSGARLLFLDRSDENTTFAIGFKTVPTDDTGVFHIMEHSVLCGSKNFPVKDPFTELLKGSVSTYLNALTSEGLGVLARYRIECFVTRCQRVEIGGYGAL